MKGFKSKRGISLIILIITIIVMIILAAAIILSISNSGIVDKANKAKEDSDVANLKEYVNVLEAEWELGVAETSSQTKTEYINTKLVEKGYNRKVTEEGVLLTESATKAIDAGIQIGDVVKYKVTSKTEMSYATENGAGDQNISNQTNLIWRYIGVSDEGEIMIAPDVTSDAPTLTLYGKTGYLNGPAELNRLCGVLYKVDGVGEARSMTIEDVNKLLGYTGPKGSYYSSLESKWVNTDTPLTIQQIVSTKKEPALTYTTTPDVKKNIGTYKADYYSISKSSEDITNTGNVDYVFYGSGSTSYFYWLASPCVKAIFGDNRAHFCVRSVGISNVLADYLFDSNGSESGGFGALRATVSLKSNIQLTKESDGWKLN